MAVLQYSYRWTDRLTDKEKAKIHYLVKDELHFACLLLPCAMSNARWPVSNLLSTTDATPLKGGGTHCTVPPPMARDLYRVAEYKGESVRLDWSLFSQQLQPTPPPRAHPTYCFRAPMEMLEKVQVPL